MEVLLDTHILLWALVNNPKLPQKAEELIQNRDNDIFYSAASIWEAEIKYAIHPENMPVSGKLLSEYCRKAGYRVLAIKEEHVHMLETLHRMENAPKHSDPFDRIMLAQAKAEKLVFLTHDSMLPFYGEECVWMV